MRDRRERHGERERIQEHAAQRRSRPSRRSVTSPSPGGRCARRRAPPWRPGPTWSPASTRVRITSSTSCSACNSGAMAGPTGQAQRRTAHRVEHSSVRRRESEDGRRF
jgi:hypothetical protein